MRWRNFLVIFLALAAGGGWWLAWHEHRRWKWDQEFDARRAALREQENSRLTGRLTQLQREQEQAADTRARGEIEKTVASLRGLPFLQSVAYKEISKSSLPAVLQQKLAQAMPDREFEANSVALMAFGLIPPGTDLKKTYLALLGEQIGAFYDQHTRELFTFSGQPLSTSQNRVILAHELTHALEDQHFHLENLPLEAKGNDDRALAASALVEGDATLVMNRFMLGQMSGAVLKESLASVFTTDIRQLASAPRFLRETLLFPYLKGQTFCEELFARGGWSALAEAFRRPPASTAEILHPERFFGQPRWEPEPVEFVAKNVRGASPLADNVLGEFAVGQVLRIWATNNADDSLAAEWNGDRYLVFGDAKKYSLLWKSIWSSEEAARRLTVAAKQGLEKRYNIALATASDGQTSSAHLSDGREVRIQQEGRTVMLIDAQDAAWADGLENLASLAAKPTSNFHE